MPDYYWEYWEGDETYSGEVYAQNEHLAYQQIRDVILNDFATIQGDEPVGVWAFTESDNVDKDANTRQFSEEDMNEILSRFDEESDTLTVDRDEF